MNWLNICRGIGEEVSREVAHAYKKEFSVREVGKGFGGDITILADKLAEDVVIKRLEQADANIKLLSEETGVVKFGKKPEFLVFADPLDGSFNYKSGIGYFGTSIAVLDANTLEPEIGYIKNIVSKSEYYALPGKGAFKNNEKIHASRKKEPRNALLECSYKATPDSILMLMKAFKLARHARALGAIAIDLCKVAVGTFDCLFYAGASRFLDVAAGNFIVKEAGGVVTDFKGNENIYKGTNLRVNNLLVAGNRQILETILRKR